VAQVKRTNARAVRAQETRRRILTAAHDLFVEQGYGATLLPEIAARADVAVQTIYFVFGNKRALLKEVVDVAVAGDLEPVATMDRPWFRAVLDAPTVPALLERLVDGSGAVLARVAAITKVVEAAMAGDPEVADLWPGPLDPRLVVLTAAAEALLTKPGRRRGLDAGVAVDVLYALLSPELYLVFVDGRGWSHQRWAAWTLATLRTQLCAPPRSPVRGAASRPAPRGGGTSR
jgi:AcrR family transcriptional regulator